MKLSLKTFLLFGCLSVLSMPAWAIEDVYSLKHDELVQKGIGFLIDEEVLPEKEAKCLVTSLNKAMAESTFDVMFRVALNEEDPSSILNAPKSDSRLPTAKKKRIYQESYDSCMKGEMDLSNTTIKKEDKSISENQIPPKPQNDAQLSDEEIEKILNTPCDEIDYSKAFEQKKWCGAFSGSFGDLGFIYISKLDLINGTNQYCGMMFSKGSCAINLNFPSAQKGKEFEANYKGYTIHKKQTL